MATDDKFHMDLIALAQMADEEIDTSDAPESTNFIDAKVGKFSDLEFRGYDIRSIANWCIARASRSNLLPTNMWLNKIIYFIYERALREAHVLLSPARLEAWEYGPVFREIYLNYPKERGSLYSRYNVQKRSSEIVTASFESQDLMLFEQVWSELGHLSASQLTKLSHKPGTPWSLVWEHGGSVNPGMLIDTNIILGRNAGQKNGTS